jgi:hypothetical protein
MPEIGQNLSHYSIVVKIGKGCIGEVFRAKDQKLGKEVFGSCIFRSTSELQAEAQYPEPAIR